MIQSYNRGLPASCIDLPPANDAIARFDSHEHGINCRSRLPRKQRRRCKVFRDCGSSRFSGWRVIFVRAKLRSAEITCFIFTLTLCLDAPVFAEMCCPAGCVQDFQPLRHYWGESKNLQIRPMLPGSSSGSSGGSGGQTYVVYQLPPPYCPPSYPTPASRDAATNQCVATLSGNAMLWGCLFEDDAGRAEDQRTGLSCPDRQKALASQCRARCAGYVASLFYCGDTSTVWQQVFGDIGGFVDGSARVDLCGPRLRIKFVILRPYQTPTQTQRSLEGQ